MINISTTKSRLAKKQSTYGNNNSKAGAGAPAASAGGGGNNNGLSGGNGSGGKNNGGFWGGVGYTLGSLGLGLAGVIEGVNDVSIAATGLLFGQTSWADWAFKDNVTGEWHRDLVESYDPDETMSFVGDVSHGVGQQAVHLLNLIPYAGPIIANVVYGVGMVGQGVSGAVEQTGELGAKEIAYGVGSGAVEFGVDKLTGGVGKYVKSIGGSTAKSFAKTAVRKGIVQNVLSSAAGEFAEEFISEYADTVLQRGLQINPEKEFSLSDALYAGMVGAVSGGVTTGAVNVTKNAFNAKRGDRIIRNGNADTVVNTAKLVADRLASDGVDFDKAPEWITALRGQSDAYNALSPDQKTGLKGKTILGELQASLYFAETQANVAMVKQKIKNKSLDEKEALAAYVSKLANKNYTAADIDADTDHITGELAILDYSMGILNIDAAMAEDAAVENKIAVEQGKGVPQGAMVQDAEGAIPSGNVENGVSHSPVHPAPAGAVQSGMRQVATVAAGETKYSIKKDSSGRKYVDVDAKIVNDTDSPKEIAKTLADVVKNKFTDFVEASGQKIGINNRASGEWVYSKDATKLRNMNNEAFIDKANAFGNADELLKVARDYVGEANKHARKDNFTEFARGVVDFKVGANGYSADIIVGTTKSGVALLYDIVNIQGKKIVDYEARTAQDRRSTSQSTTDIIHQNDPKVNTQTQNNSDQKDLAEKGARIAQERTEVSKSADVGEAQQTGAEAKGEAQSETSAAAGAESEADVNERRTKAEERARKWAEWEENTKPTAKELNAAREYVKSFDSLENNRRLAIIRMIRSAEGKVDEKTLRGVANLMAMRGKNGQAIAPDLEFRFAEGISDLGLRTHIGDKTLILINSDSEYNSTMRGTIAHELVHYIENKAGYDALSKYVLSIAKKERIAEIEAEYIADYEARNQTYTQADLDKEVVAKLVGKALNSEKFLARYAQKDDKLIKKLGRFLKGIVSAQREDAELSEVATKMMAMFDKALGQESVSESGGDKRSIAGKKAKTADRIKLATAQDMIVKGADSETVRKETGWFKGYDGKWRFEIDDFESALIDGPKLERHEDDGDVYYTGKLTDILNHKELFEAYPELKDINIIIQQTEFGVDAIYQPNSNYITLSREHFKRYTKAYNEYLNGGRKTEIERIEQSSEFKEYNKWYDDEIADNMEPTKWLEGELAARNKFFSSELGKRYHQLKYSKDGFIGEKFELGWDTSAKEVILHELQHAIQKIEGFATGTNTRDKNYDRNAGEIEARDVERRADMTAEQRKNTRPDIDREDVVFAEWVSDSFSYIGDTADNRRCYVSGFDISMTMDEKIKLFKDRISTIFNLGAVELKTDVKKIQIKGDKFTSQKNLFGDKSGEVGEYEAKINALYDLADILATSTYDPTATNPEDSYINSNNKPKNAAHKGVKYWYKFRNHIVFDGVPYVVTFNIRDKGKEQYQYLIDFKEDKTPGLSNTAIKNLLRADQASYSNSISQKSDLSTQNDKKDLAPKKKNTEGEEKAGKKTEKKTEKNAEDAKALRKMSEQIAREKAKLARVQNAKTYTKQEIAVAIDGIEALTDMEVLRLADGKQLASLTRERREELASQIYVAMHDASAEGESGRGSVVVKGIATKIVQDIVDHERIVDEDGKSYHFKDVFDASSISSLVQELAQDLYESFAAMGTQTSNSSFTAAVREVKEKVSSEYASKAKAESGMPRAAREVSFQATRLKQMAETQKRGIEDDGISLVTKKLGGIVDAKGNIFVGRVDEAVGEAERFFSAESLKREDGSLTSFVKDNDMEISYLIEEFKLSRQGREGQMLKTHEMQLLGKILGGMYRVIREYNQVYVDGHWVDMDKLAQESVSDMTSFFGDKQYKNAVTKFLGEKIGKRINELYFYNILSPENVIEALEGYKNGGILKSLYHSVRVAKQRSEHLSVKLKKPFAEFLDDKEKNTWKDEKGRKRTYRQKLNEKIVNVNGNEITLGEGIYLYMLTKREQSHAGLRDAGFVTYDENNQRKKKFKIEDVEAARGFLYGQFDDADKAYIAMAEEFFNKTSTEIKSNADREILGFTNTLSGYYVPIIRDRYSRMQGVTDMRQSAGSIVTVYNKSFNQNTVQNAKALEGKNIQSIINDHADGLADYAEMYLPLKAFDRVYNRRVTASGGSATTIREVLNNDVWNGSQNYFKNLFADIQGESRRRDGFIDDVVGKLRSGWVNSVLGLNLKVVATQTTSYVAANQVIEAKYLVPAMAKFVGNQSELGVRADEYSDIIEARSFDMGSLKAQGNVDRINEIGKKSGFMIEAMDRRVCLAIFHAAELKAQDQGHGKVGTVENAKAAAKIADEVIYTTQAMTSQAERSALQRSPSEIAKAFSMFTSDTVKNLSHTWSSVMRYIAHSQRAKTDSAYKQMLGKDARKIGRSAATMAMTGVMLGLITQAFKYLYAKEEEEPEDKLEDLTTDIVSSTLNVFPIFSDILDKFLFDYDLSLNVFDIANDTIEDTAAVFDMAGKAMGGQFVSDDEIGKTVINAVKTYGTLLGVPLAPVERTVTGLLRRFAPQTVYDYDTMFKNTSYTADLKKAVESGDEALAEHILTSLYKNEATGVYASEELEEIARLYSIVDEEGKHPDVLPQKIGTEIEGVTLSAAQRRKFASIYGGASNAVVSLIGSDIYQDMTDEERVKAIKNTYKLYYNRAKSATLGTELSKVEVYSALLGDKSELYVLAQAKRVYMKEYKNRRGKKVTVKDQVEDLLDEMELSKAERLILLYALGYTGKENTAALIKLLNSLKLPDEELTQIAAALGFAVEKGKVVEKDEDVA